MANDETRAIQAVITFGLGSVACYFAWPHLDAGTKGIIFLFAMLAGISIHNGTWMADSRVMRRQARDQRREVYREAREWAFGKSASSKPQQGKSKIA